MNKKSIPNHSNVLFLYTGFISLAGYIFFPFLILRMKEVFINYNFFTLVALLNVLLRAVSSKQESKIIPLNPLLSLPLIAFLGGIGFLLIAAKNNLFLVATGLLLTPIAHGLYIGYSHRLSLHLLEVQHSSKIFFSRHHMFGNAGAVIGGVAGDILFSVNRRYSDAALASSLILLALSLFSFVIIYTNFDVRGSNLTNQSIKKKSKQSRIESESENQNSFSSFLVLVAVLAFGYSSLNFLFPIVASSFDKDFPIGSMLSFNAAIVIALQVPVYNFFEKHKISSLHILLSSMTLIFLSVLILLYFRFDLSDVHLLYLFVIMISLGEVVLFPTLTSIATDITKHGKNEDLVKNTLVIRTIAMGSAAALWPVIPNNYAPFLCTLAVMFFTVITTYKFERNLKNEGIMI